MKAEKSHDLPSASWVFRKASGVLQSEFKGLRTRGPDDVKPSLRTGEEQMRCLSFLVRKQVCKMWKNVQLL